MIESVKIIIEIGPELSTAICTLAVSVCITIIGWILFRRSKP